MKISYILQLKDFGVMLLIGIIIGALYGILSIITTIKRKLVFQIIIDLISTIVATFTLIIMINYINMGQFRVFLVLGYTLGIIIERITIGKLFAKGYKFMYNNIVKSFRKFANSKFGKVVLK